MEQIAAALAAARAEVRRLDRLFTEVSHALNRSRDEVERLSGLVAIGVLAENRAANAERDLGKARAESEGLRAALQDAMFWLACEQRGDGKP